VGAQTISGECPRPGPKANYVPEWQLLEKQIIIMIIIVHNLYSTTMPLGGYRGIKCTLPQ